MAKKRDANHSEIVKAFRAYRCHVADTADLGKGFPDIVVSFRGFTVLVEIKDGSKEPSKRKLTKAEEKFKHEFQGWLSVVESVDDVCKLFNQIQKRYREQLRYTEVESKGQRG